MNIETKDFVVATTKGIVGVIPFAGAFLSEYIGLVQDNITNKRTQEWREKVEEKLQQLKVSVQELSKDEFFYNCYQETMYGFLKNYEKKKRDMYINSLMNCRLQTLSEDKKMRFIRLLDMYTLNGIYLLRYFAEAHNEQTNQIGNVRTRTFEGTEKPYEKALKDNVYLENDKDYFISLAGQFTNDGLISPRDIMWEHPVDYSVARRKKTSKLGDEFLKFIDKGI